MHYLFLLYNDLKFKKNNWSSDMNDELKIFYNMKITFSISFSFCSLNSWACKSKERTIFNILLWVLIFTLVGLHVGLLTTLILDMHSDGLARHCDWDKTIDLVMRKKVQDYVKLCFTCQTAKRTSTNARLYNIHSFTST